MSEFVSLSGEVFNVHCGCGEKDCNICNRPTKIEHNEELAKCKTCECDECKKMTLIRICECKKCVECKGNYIVLALLLALPSLVILIWSLFGMNIHGVLGIVGALIVLAPLNISIILSFVWFGIFCDKENLTPAKVNLITAVGWDIILMGLVASTLWLIFGWGLPFSFDWNF